MSGGEHKSQTGRGTAWTGSWRRERLLVTPKPDHAWWHSHAQAPTILPLSDRLWRVYFAVRERQPRSHILCADIDPADGFRLLRIHPDPVLQLGAEGTFDSGGMGPGCALMIDDQVYLYYTGLAPRCDIPHQLAIGLAVSDDGVRFRRKCKGPVLSTGPRDPLFASTPCVRQGKDGFEMWYASGTGWRRVGEAWEPSYVIRHARSHDGIIWSLATELTLPSTAKIDYGQVRSWVLQGPDGLHLWYSRRGSEFRAPGDAAYRLMHTVLDGRSLSEWLPEPITFENPPREGDWDSWMQAYPCVARFRDDLVMFYNGDHFGRAGFGYARLIGAAKSMTGEAESNHPAISRPETSL